MSNLRFNAAAIQTDLPNPARRQDMKRNTSRIVELIDMAVTGYAPFLPVRLLVFPEFAHSAPAYETLKQLRERLGVEIPNEHTEAVSRKARELGVFIQMGSMLELDPKYPGALFNTTCLVGPQGILYRYRKVNPWLPWEVHTSPHDIDGYEEDLFPVAETEIGTLGSAICYDWIFPEVLRELALRGAEILLRVSAYMDPFGATEPNSWWTTVNRCRALENIAYVVAANQAASLKNYPPFSWPGGSMIVDYDGRIVSQATPGSGEKITIGPIDVEMLRDERERRSAHQMLLHLRTETSTQGRRKVFPGGTFQQGQDLTFEENVERVDHVRRTIGKGR